MLNSCPTVAHELYDFTVFCAAAFFIVACGVIASVAMEHAWTRVRTWWGRRHGR